MQYAVQMWFKYTGNNFHVTGKKTDLGFLRGNLHPYYYRLPLQIRFFLLTLQQS